MTAVPRKSVIAMFLAAAAACMGPAVSPATAKPPITEGETDPILLDVSPYLIEVFAGEPDAQGDPLGPDASLVDREKIPGVILLSADRHRTEVWKIVRPGGYTRYEFESSKLTNMHTHGTRAEALWSYNRGNFFSLLTFDLTAADPEVTFRCVTREDEVPYSLTVKRSQLEAR